MLFFFILKRKTGSFLTLIFKLFKEAEASRNINFAFGDNAVSKFQNLTVKLSVQKTKRQNNWINDKLWKQSKNVKGFVNINALNGIITEQMTENAQ